QCSTHLDVSFVISRHHRYLHSFPTRRSSDLLRFAAYHLISAANPHDERASIGARALTGHAYRGHVFWDTEIFMLPFFVLTWPEADRKSTRLNSSHVKISYAVFCLKKKNIKAL